MVDQTNLDTLLRDVDDAFQRGALRDALGYLKQAAVIAPKQINVWVNTSYIAYLLGDLTQALDAGRRGVALKVDDPHIHLNYGNALRAAGHIEEAINSSKQRYHCYRHMPKPGHSSTWPT